MCLHPEITAAARAHAQDELDKEYYSHYAPDGSKPADRMKRSGYTLCDRPSHGCGENIDAGSGSNGTPDNSFKELMNSPGHKANILRKEFREVGIGARTGNHKGHEGVVMYVMDFGGEWP